MNGWYIGKFIYWNIYKDTLYLHPLYYTKYTII